MSSDGFAAIKRMTEPLRSMDELTDELDALAPTLLPLLPHAFNWSIPRASRNLAIINSVFHALNGLEIYSDILDGTYRLDNRTFKFRVKRCGRQLVSCTVDGGYEKSLGQYDGAFHPSKLLDEDEATVVSYIERIRENPQEHSTAFGFHSGRCGVCGRLLSNPESVERGIGPDCASKYGWL